MEISTTELVKSDAVRLVNISNLSSTLQKILGTVSGNLYKTARTESESLKLDPVAQG